MKARILSLVLILTASAANAETAANPAEALAQAILATPTAGPQPPSPGLSRPRAASRYASALPAGIARTSIDRRFGDDDAVGSFGYLCGLNPGQKMTGAAGAAGYDPMGKFLGAKLSFAFR